MYSINTSCYKITWMNLAFHVFLKTKWVLIWSEMGYWLLILGYWLLEPLQERQTFAKILEYVLFGVTMSNLLIYKRDVKVWKTSLALIASRNGGGKGLALDDTHGLDSFSAWGGAVLVLFLCRLFNPCFGIMCWIRWFSRFFWFRAVQGSVCWKRCYGLATQD